MRIDIVTVPVAEAGCLTHRWTVIVTASVWTVTATVYVCVYVSGCL